ncbi:serine hydrolase family protein [Rhizobium grahamii]|uniref:Serine hydrolase family protein n=1 Tax=Rhizobium grahamii TaxID=1120045 RepID=A0A5Q0CB20_9HYPH|nr:MULTISPECIES: alpha/beta hydrolase [Rhizobium]QFY61077.1 serine hydrolase family protein [Rhizobium grahamii]QRM49771.1 serine hydrolase family protein [Rhizobium sp. BG6]
MTPVLVLPGLFGSEDAHWQSAWLKDHPESRLVEQDNWDRPQLNVWLERLEASLEEAGEAYIVAHSLGCVLAASLAGRPSASRAKGALLVAPCDLPATERLHAGQIAFGTMPTARLPFASLLVGSLNDHYMSLDRLTLFARLWGSELRNVGLAGHINVASGYGRWPGGYRLFETLKARIRHLDKIPPMKPALGRAVPSLL